MSPTARAGLLAGLIVFVLAGCGVALAVALRPASRPRPTRPALPVIPAPEGQTVDTPDPSTAEARARAVVLLGVGVGYFLTVLLVASWIGRDAGNRGHEGGAWAVLFFAPHFLPVILPVVATLLGLVYLLFATAGLALAAWSGLPIYLLARRRGRLEPCKNCGLSRLEYVRACPHCGARGAAFVATADEARVRRR
jgi:hypothetical protein